MVNKPEKLLLKIFVPPELTTLREFYRIRIQEHNSNINNPYADSGFDLGLPRDYTLDKKFGNKVCLDVHASMWQNYTYGNNDGYDGNNDGNNGYDGNNGNNGYDGYIFGNNIPQAYYLYPRSSISKTPMRLSNSVGIIDKGYRGPITAMVDIIDSNIQEFNVYAIERYFQICHPLLNFFKVVMVDSKADLGITDRNESGFGSTGL